MIDEKFKIIEEYQLDNSTAFNLIHDGQDNKVYLLDDNNKKKYILRESKRNDDNKDTDFEINLLLKLSQSSLNAPILIVAKNDNYYVIINNKCFVLFEYKEGHQFENVSEEMLLNNVIFLGGKKLGELHSVTKDIDVKINLKRTIFTEFERLLVVPIENLVKLDGYSEFFEYVKKFYYDAQNLVHNNKVKSGIIHNDYRIQNLIFSKDNTEISIIDFDWSCRGPFLKDIGLAIVEWSMFDFEKGPSKKAIQQFIDGYNIVGPIKIEYNAELIFWICFSCLSDACTFFCDLKDLRYGDILITKTDQCRMYKKFKYFLKESE